MTPERSVKRTSIPPLNGVRFIAFLLVLFNHGPAGTNPVTATLNQYGWIGVEIFFVISSYLLFMHLEEEKARTGGISIAKFFERRLLRIYPLLVVFPLMMLIVSDVKPWEFAFRYAGLLFSVDNIITWWKGYNYGVPFSPHLWTLSYEFQVYLFIPFAFLAYRGLGKERFLRLLLLVWCVCTATRAAAVWLAVDYRVIWVTPFFRPDSVLLGLLLFIGIGARQPVWMFIASAIGSFALVITNPNVNVVGPWLMMLYPVVAIFAFSIVWLSLKANILATILGSRILNYLGTISYGLYVYHIFARELGKRTTEALGFTEPGAYYACYMLSTLAITISLASISFAVIERPLLKLKRRVSQP
jgi:peptidoglycan/LPS O-acetylase OafA/YrhL